MTDDTDLPATQADLDALDSKNNTDKLGIQTGLRNDTLVVQLTIAFQTADLLDKVNQAKSTDWSDRLAKNIIVRLKRNFQYIDRLLIVEMRRKVNDESMKNDGNLKVIFEQISTIIIITLVQE